MNFEEAFKLMKDGKCVKRKCWGDDHEVLWIRQRIMEGEEPAEQIETDDLLCEDWEEVIE